MDDLLEAVIDAHGGLKRWNQLNGVSARLIQGGALWALKGQPRVLDDVVVTARLHQERASHRPFRCDVADIRLPPSTGSSLAPDGQSLAEPLVVSIDLREIAFTSEDHMSTTEASRVMPASPSGAAIWRAVP